MGELSLTAIDIVVIAVIFFSAAFAMFRGLIHETFSIIEWVAGIYVALRFTPVLQPLLGGLIKPDWLEWAAVFIGAFLIVFIPLSILSRRLSAMVKKSDIGSVDRTLGLVYGAARGLVIVGLAYIVFAALVPFKDYPQTLTNARLFPLIRNTSEVLRSLVPETGDLFRARVQNPDEPQEKDAPKTYGADAPSALDRLFQTKGGSDSSSP
jgi:membrane protein required for colicin V production